MSTALPKMKINGYKKLTKLPVNESFSAKSFGDSLVKMDVVVNDDIKHYVFSVPGFLVMGWTTNETDAFQALNNMSAYTIAEIYEAFRGRKF